MSQDPKKAFRSFVTAAPAAAPVLPVVHTTEARDLASVLRYGLQPAPCKVFDERLLYFFYGRPAYKKQIAETIGYHDPYMPIAFILPLQGIGTIRRIHPFDSGAFQDNRYDETLLEGFDLKHFELDPDPEVPPRIVGAFFGTNQRYYEGECQPYRENDVLDYVVGGHKANIRNQSARLIDDRRYTIEIAVAGPVSLERHAEAIVLPRKFLEADDITGFLEKCPSIELLPYPTPKATDPAGLYHQIYGTIFTYMRIREMLS